MAMGANLHWHIVGSCLRLGESRGCLVFGQPQQPDPVFLTHLRLEKQDLIPLSRFAGLVGPTQPLLRPLPLPASGGPAHIRSRLALLLVAAVGE